MEFEQRVKLMQAKWDIANSLLSEAKCSSKELQSLLSHAEKEMDTINGNYGSKGVLCLFCGADGYDGVHGIIHSEDCIIQKIRYFRNGNMENY